jgi:CRISPR type III-A-associated RAMP protein Csm4
MPARLFKLRPSGPWRPGPNSGARDRVDRVCHSDTLYSAVSSAMLRLGWGEEWFEATARSESPAVRLSSLFPWQHDSLLAPAPANLWPPQGTSKLRASAARFIPAFLTGLLASGQPFQEEHWDVDALSECLLRRGRGGTGPFRIALRSHASVDRLEQGQIQLHQAACLEFEDNAGLWCAAECADDGWADRLEGALRLLGDSGIGGKRSLGWGHFEIASVRRGDLATLVLGSKFSPDPSAETAHWILSLVSPGGSDAIDWTRGSYELLERGGRVESEAEWGSRKKSVRMIREGSVLFAPEAPKGAARDVAPEGFPHPVYRCGLALSIPLPWTVNA